MAYPLDFANAVELDELGIIWDCKDNPDKMPSELFCNDLKFDTKYDYEDGYHYPYFVCGALARVSSAKLSELARSYGYCPNAVVRVYNGPAGDKYYMYSPEVWDELDAAWNPGDSWSGAQVLCSALEDAEDELYRAKLRAMRAARGTYLENGVYVEDIPF